MADKIRKSKHTVAEIDAAIDMLLEGYTRDEIDDLLSEKVNAVSGKGLSTNDFTDAEKQKLASLQNYDDADVKNDISEAKSQAAVNKTTLGYQRKNLLKNTATSQTKNGVTFTVNGDESVTVNGTASADAEFNTFIGVPSELFFDTPLKLSGCPKNGSAYTYRYFLQDLSTGYITLGVDIGNGVDIIINKNVTKIRCMIKIYAGYTAENLTFYPMLRPAEITDDTYEPYKPSVEERLNEITDQIFGLGTNIPSGADLNDYTQAGVYYAENSTKAGTLLNVPYKQTGFRLEVYYQTNYQRFIQKLLPNVASGVFFYRVYASGGFGSWYKFAGEEVTT